MNPGTRLGSYEIVAPIGAGGMGEVDRGRDPKLGRDVAIKVLPAAIATHPDRLDRFEQEARAPACSIIRKARPTSSPTCSKGRRCARRMQTDVYVVDVLR